MNFHVVTLYPEMIQNYFQFGVVGSAKDKKVINVTTINPREFTSDIHKTVDDRPYGGGDGMVLLASVLEKSVQSIQIPNGRRQKVIYLSAQGQSLDEKKVIELSGLEDLVLINGRYGGVDQRFINSYVDEEISIGNYVLSGGELATLVLIDAITRKIPGVLGHNDSASEDSFSVRNQGGLEAPLFTRPSEWNGQLVPEVLREGHHQKIQEWRWLLSKLVTLQKRPDLSFQLSVVEKRKLIEFFEGLSADEKKVLGLSQSLNLSKLD